MSSLFLSRNSDDANGWAGRVQLVSLHSFLLEHRQSTFDSEWQFATEMKHEIRALIGDSEEIFAMGFLELAQALLDDGLETVQGVGGAAAAGSLSAPSLISVGTLLLDDIKFCKRVSAQVR
jgi:hypothetical protein